MAIWESLALAAAGGVIGTVGTWVGARTQIRAADRARNVQYARDDKYRLHKERIEAYSRFYIAAGRVRATLYSNPLPDEPTKLAVRRELWDKFTTMVLLAEASVLHVANDILDYTDSVFWRGERFQLDIYVELIQRLQRAARADVIGFADSASTSPDVVVGGPEVDAKIQADEPTTPRL
ncbi:hypothetical protein ACIA5D_38195 [Actinoplanes sp. NPDC051513]|uniref:hypothetical protein n=1 Tax=Actinoplanes sp. NPDC051513 TaxID=3363908 RepID=UPI00378D12F5